MSVRVNFGNVYVHNRTTGRAKKVLRRGNPDFIVVNEGGNIRRFAGYRRYADPYGTDAGRTDVQVYAKKGIQHRGLLSIQLQPPMNAFPAAHTRFAVVALSWIPGVGSVAVVGVHPTPSPTALRASRPTSLSLAYAGAMKRLTTLLGFLEDVGYLVVVAGDVQIPAGQAGNPQWDPYETLRNAGFRVATTAHLDVIGVGKGLKIQKAEVLEPAGATTGSDHPFLTVTVARAKRNVDTRPDVGQGAA